MRYIHHEIIFIIEMIDSYSAKWLKQRFTRYDTKFGWLLDDSMGEIWKFNKILEKIWENVFSNVNDVDFRNDENQWIN